MIIGSICSNVVYDICIYVLLFVYNLVSPFKELFNCRSFPRACLTLLFVLYWNTWLWKINRRSAQAWKDVVILLSLSHSTHVWSYHANFIDPSRHLRILGTCFTFLKSKHTKLCKGIMRMPKLLELQNGTNTESPQIIGKSSSTSPSSTLQIQVFILSSLRVPVVFFTWMTVVFLIPKRSWAWMCFAILDTTKILLQDAPCRHVWSCRPPAKSQVWILGCLKNPCNVSLQILIWNPKEKENPQGQQVPQD